MGDIVWNDQQALQEEILYDSRGGGVKSMMAEYLPPRCHDE
ncbi:MAG: hypothetical protein ACRYFU_14940 [Janthinobacterium lividum]